MPIKPTTAEFIQRAHAVHGVGSYDYSQVFYKNSWTKVAITCHDHGPFEQKPNSHLTGHGCPVCGLAKTTKATTKDTATFIKQARAIHGDKFDYSLVEYVNNQTPVTIICPDHGPFEQKPSNHMQGKGCLACARRTSQLPWIERAAGKEVLLYFVRFYSEREEFFKIGVTLKSINRRYSGGLEGYQYEVLAVHKSTNAAAVYDWEQSIIETFVHLRYRPKIFFAGASECFSSADEILAIFPL